MFPEKKHSKPNFVGSIEIIVRSFPAITATQKVNVLGKVNFLTFCAFFLINFSNLTKNNLPYLRFCVQSKEWLYEALLHTRPNSNFLTQKMVAGGKVKSLVFLPFLKFF